MKSIKEIIKTYKDQQDIKIKGWITSNRGNTKIRFININDGSTISNIQLVLTQEKFDLEEISHIFSHTREQIGKGAV